MFKLSYIVKEFLMSILFFTIIFVLAPVEFFLIMCLYEMVKQSF